MLSKFYLYLYDVKSTKSLHLLGDSVSLLSHYTHTNFLCINMDNLYRFFPVSICFAFHFAVTLQFLKINKVIDIESYILCNDIYFFFTLNSAMFKVGQK